MSDQRRLEQAAVALVRHHQFVGADTRALVELLGRGTLFRQPAGTVLCREGEPADALFFLLDGRVQILADDAHEEQREIALIEAPAIVGHVGVADGTVRSVTCAVLQQATLVSLDAVTYRAILDQPSATGTALRRILLSSLAQQLSSSNSRLRSLLARHRQRDERKQRKRSRRPADATPRPSASGLIGEETEADLLDLAGVAVGWQVDSDGVDDLRLAEDEDMRRSKLRRKR